MVRMIVRRLLVSVIIIWLVATVVFLATQALPGDAARAILGREATPDRLAALQLKLGTNRPILEQYTSWLGRLLHGNLGDSLANGRSVASFLGPLVLNSLVLMALAALISTVGALAIGVWTAARRDTVFDHVNTALTLVIAALPEFVIGIALIWVFAIGVFHLLPAVYLGAPGDPTWNHPTALVLPTLTLVLAVAPYLTRMMRGTTIEVLESAYVQQAELKGLPARTVLFRHAVPNALGPVIQVVALQFAWLAGGVVIVEYLFHYPGIGSAVVDAVNTRDLPVVQALALFFGLFYVVVNLIADVMTLVLNPRVRTAQQ